MKVDMKNFLITGAAGSLGHSIANLLIQEKVKVIGFIMANENDEDLDSRVIRITGDVLDKASLKRAYEALGPHGTVIHCAGMISIDPKVSERIYEVNVQGTKNVIELAQDYKVDQFIYVSSVHAIPELKKGLCISETQEISPDKVMGHYSKSKAMATLYLMDQMKQGFPATIVYPSGIISNEDTKQSFMTQMVKDFLGNHLRISIKGGYDFVDVRDVASAIITIAQKKIINEHYILSNRFYTIKEILTMLHELTGIAQAKITLPVTLVRWVLPIKLALDRRRHTLSLYTQDSLKILQSNSIFSHLKAKKALNYHPRDIKETFQNLILRLKGPYLPLE